MLWLVGCVAIWPFPAQARQEAAREVGAPIETILRIPADGVLILRPFIVSGSLRVELEGEIVAPSAYVLDEAAGRLQWLEVRSRVGLIVFVRYRVLALSLDPVTRLVREASFQETAAPAQIARRAAVANTSPGLRSSGAVTRGLIAGTGRDVSIESGLRLEVEGSPAPGVSVTAALTDETIPVRPDGSTQRLDEFDRVAIEIAAPAGQMRLGDFDVALGDSRFARFARKLQGASVDSRFGLTRAITGRVIAAGATVRGQFRIQTLVPLDGVQGPYRLEGEAGERFILVVPGSESVWLDGRRLVRGTGYTIDYATGEVSFSNGTLISSDRRITVEFSYSLNRYTRTVVATEAGAAGWNDRAGRPRLALGVSWLREADSGDFAEEFGLTPADSSLLAGVGDRPALRSGAVPVPFDPEAPYVQYRVERIGADTVFVALDRAPDIGEIVYRVAFSRVEDGTGHYERAGQTVNGIVYAWSERGDYEPVRRLPQPQSRRIVDFRGAVRPIPGLDLRAEWARSVHDLNRLSTVDSFDDVGDAIHLEVSLGAPNHSTWSAVMLHQRWTRNFSSFDRIRPVEFARDWNIDPRSVRLTGGVSGTGAEALTDGRVRWLPTDSTVMDLDVARVVLGDGLDASRIRGTIRRSLPGKPRFTYAVAAVRSQARFPARSGVLFSQQLRLDGSGRRALEPYMEAEYEHRTTADSVSALDGTSIRYLELRPGLSFESGAWYLGSEIERRSEAWPIHDRLVPAAVSWTARGDARYRGAWVVSLGWGYRIRDVQEEARSLPGAGDTRALLISNEVAGKLHERVALTWSYEARTERLPTLQEVYFRAGPERGEFVWLDENRDGIIQLDEFLPESTPDEGLYVRTYLPSDSLASVASVRSRLRLALDPGGASLLRAWSGQTVFEVEEKSRTDERADIYLLRLDRFRVPGLTVDGRIRFRQDLSLQPAGARLAADASYTLARSLSELAAGIERRNQAAAEFRLRGRLNRVVDASVVGRLEHQETGSTAFSSRRYDIRSRSLAPGVTWRATDATTLRLTLEVARKDDRIGSRSSNVARLPISLRFARPGKADVVLRFEASDVRLKGQATGLAAWELTDGRGPGRSWSWGATVQWDLGGSLRATAGYDGRAPSAAPVIHTGRIELTARF